MRVEQLRLQNVRSHQDVTVHLDDVTPLIGANGSGKSTVLRSIEFVLGRHDFTPDDVTGRRPDVELRVTITCSDLGGLATPLDPWLDEDGRLSITRVGRVVEGRLVTHFESRRRQIPDFQLVRELDTAGDQVAAYRELRDTTYPDLPAEQSGVRVRAAMDAYEVAHPQACEALPDQSLAIGQGGDTDIGRLIHHVAVPAVHDAAAEAYEGRGNVFSSLTELLVRSDLDLEAGLEELRQDGQSRYGELVASMGDDVLSAAQQRLSAGLRRYAPQTGVHLTWDPQQVTVPGPKIRAELSEGGFRGEIGHQGHGVQRAYLFTLLQALAEVRMNTGEPVDTADDGEVGDEPLLLLVIEEPELYQHPLRAQLLYGVLTDLAVGRRPSTQVVYATHSPYFVTLDLVDALCLLQSRPDGDGVPDTTVTQVDLEAAAHELWEANERPGDPYTAESLRSRLGVFVESEVSEGLFAAGVVLVEGQEDAALLAGAEEQLGVQLAALGIAVLPVGGKTCLDRPLVLLRQLGIPTYVVFDGDAGGDHPETNRLLLRLLGRDPVDHPESSIESTHAVFAEDFPAAVADDIGEAYGATLAATCAELGFAAGDGRKNRAVLRETFRRLGEAGHRSGVLTDVLEAVVALMERVGEPAPDP